MKNLGGMAGFLDKMPGMSGVDIQSALAEAKPEERVKQMEALIHSMTPFERANPDKINPSRRRRIAAGSGKQIQDVNALLKQHKQMAKMMKMISRPDGIAKMMKAVQGLTRGMAGQGGGGPLFGGGQQNVQQMAQNVAKMGIGADDIATAQLQEQMQEQMSKAQGSLSGLGVSSKPVFRPMGQTRPVCGAILQAMHGFFRF